MTLSPMRAPRASLSALAIMTLFLSVTGCGAKRPSTSEPTVSTIPQTDVEAQAINNCWAYAVTGWIETLHLRASGNEIDLSEAYLTYWASMDRLLTDHQATKIEMGGNWQQAQKIITTHGWLVESDFLPNKPGTTDEARQLHADAFINEQLKEGGRLFGKATRTQANIQEVLDEAFMVDGKAARARAKMPKDLTVSWENGKTKTLNQALSNIFFKWKFENLAQDMNKPEMSAQTAKKRMEVYRRMQRAINDGIPLLISFDVAFGMLDNSDNTFKMPLFRESGKIGKTGGHMVVVTDYVVDDVPGVGTLGEGEVEASLKTKALQGKIRYFKVKNSWGTRPEDKLLENGHYRLPIDYLDAQLSWPHQNNKIYAPLRDVLLPPGY